ncbi:MAG: Na(+)-translocating NADH-quinone reductase subunit A [Bacteroidales bacterium]|nr:Na(+)-translocating NADH-quinone reductase subunit A [Bacteroidales bacterium]
MSNVIVLKNGLDIPMKGNAEPVTTKTVSPAVVAIQPTDFKGLSPRLMVKEGDAVLAGSPVIADKKNPDIILCSPVSGKVKEILRGDKRRLLAVLITPDDEQKYVDFKPANPEKLTADEIIPRLLQSGLWPWLVQRPYGIVADPAAKPRAIFVSAFDSAPLAADRDFTLGQELNAVQTGIKVLAKLTDGGVHVGLWEPTASSTPFHKLEDCVFHTFRGRHPAGNVGVQISHVAPIRKGDIVWTISLLGVAAIGRLFQTGKVNLRRKVAITGPMAINPSYVDAVPGMPMKSIAGYYGDAGCGVRIVSGNVLSGKAAGPEGFLGFFDDQVTILREGDEKELFGWLRPIRYKQFSTDHCYFSWLTPWRKYDLSTNLHGGPRAFIMNDSYYSKVLPMDIYPLFLTKACLAGDIDRMEKFGIYEVLPEDLALCEFVDPSKNNVQDIIAKGIDLMLKEMA